jgi:hypothetical protein
VHAGKTPGLINLEKLFKVFLPTFRDKKKAYMDEMEQLVSGLRAEQARLRANNATLTVNNQRLLQENLALREENTLLVARLSSHVPQQNELKFTDDLNVEAASFVVATSLVDEDILLSPSCNSSSSLATAVAPAPVAQLPEPAVLTEFPLQQEQNVRPAVAATAAACPPPLSSDRVLSPKGLTTGSAAVPWWALQMVLCYSALWTTMCLVSATTAVTMNAKSSASADATAAASPKSLSAPSPILPLKKRPGRAWWEEMLLKPPLADPPPD